MLRAPEDKRINYDDKENIPPNSQTDFIKGVKKPTPNEIRYCHSETTDNPWNKIRQDFAPSHGNVGYIVGRVNEKQEIQKFLENPSKKDCFLYVCGNPGTGKTAVVCHKVGEFCNQHKMGFEYFNCATRNYAHKDIFETKADILIIDEFDHLSSKLEKQFTKKVIGIANTLDPNLHTQIIQFQQYTASETLEILMAKNKNGNAFDHMALDFCSRKVASIGDLRRAFALAQQAITEAKQKSKHKVDFECMLAACSKLIGGMSADGVLKTKLDQCTLHQKLVLISFVVLAKPSSLNTFYEHYEGLFKNHALLESVEPLSKSAFIDALNALEYHGLVQLIRQKKRGRTSSVTGTPFKMDWNNSANLVHGSQSIQQILEEFGGSIVATVLHDERLSNIDKENLL